MRQIAVRCAVGEHPFTGAPIDPLRVLVVDFENTPRQIRRKLKPLLSLVGDQLDPDRLRIWSQTEGVDLSQPGERQRLAQVIEHSALVDFASLESPVVVEERGENWWPVDLLVIGPIYRMVTGNPNDEEVGKHVSLFVDELRVRFGCAVVIEHHEGHGDSNGRRPRRPIGTSLWLRWPEFGMDLGKDGSLYHWRGPRDEREWPPMVKRGGEWPWTPEGDALRLTFARLIEEVQGTGLRLSERELAERTGGSKSQIHRAIEHNKAQWEAVLADLRT